MRNRLDAPIPETLVVTGHPNHELAILGLVQRARPHFLVITDGGNPERVAESLGVFENLGLGDRVRFLNAPEGELYSALLEGDFTVVLGLVGEIRSTIDAMRPRQIFCESIEFYNPLHDLTLPLARAAARHRPDIAMLEFPLIAEIPNASGRYRVQRPPGSRERAAEKLCLTAQELAVKRDAGAHSYLSLRRQMGDLLDGIPSEQAATEYFLEASRELPVPGTEHALRYEERGRALQRQGFVDRVITFHGHFLPAVRALEGS